MNPDEISSTSLWKTAFECSGNQLEDIPRNRLQSELDGFRTRANYLVSYIQKSLPSLTLHDASHLDALWRVASLLAGENYPLNPMEAFVLGGAILLHDAALCVEAYENGLTGIRQTTIWLDSLAVEKARNPNGIISEIESNCDFLAMRALHADRANDLGQYAWKSHADGSNIYLISDATLRNHLGGLIGRIASSHHWSIEDVRDKLPSQLNPPSGFPSDWGVDAIKVACLLRTADAAHFCQDRAPDFLHALYRRSGVSYAHWNAQNRITGPSLQASDPTGKTIVYTSTQDFSEGDAKSWWVAFDALDVVKREITSSNQLLNSRNSNSAPPLKVEAVAGANSVNDLTKYIRVVDWEPTDANIHISDVESLVKNLGGDKLYGVTTPAQKMHIVIRELIQNSRDAILARRTIHADFEGKITIRLLEENGTPVLQIEDNGIGMSRRVLTGPLLDFGNSFWSSDLVKSELPGLKASGYESIGKFGIGFYSIFMIAASATISSRRWNTGEQDTTQLVFKDGLSMRPIVKSGRAPHHHWSASTVVRLHLRDDCAAIDLDAITVPSGIGGVPDFTAPLSDLIASWVPGLDVPVEFIRLEQPTQQIHGGKPGTNPDINSLLRSISLCSHRGSIGTNIQEKIANSVGRVRPVGKAKFGLAAISSSAGTNGIGGGVRSVGGFGHFSGNGDDKFIGYIECVPESARRGVGEFLAPPEVIKGWAQEQVSLFEGENPDDLKRAFFGLALAEFGVDPAKTVRVLVLLEHGAALLSIDALASLAATMPILIAESNYFPAADTYAELTPIAGHAVVRFLSNGKFSDLKRESNIPAEENSMLGCLYRSIRGAGLTMQITTSPVIFKSFTGSPVTFAVRALA